MSSPTRQLQCVKEQKHPSRRQRKFPQLQLHKLNVFTVIQEQRRVDAGVTYNPRGKCINAFMALASVHSRVGNTCAL